MVVGRRCAPRFLRALCLLQIGRLEVNGAGSLAQGEGPHSKASTQWRVVNLDAVEYGWAVGEVKMFSDTTCSTDLTKPDTAPKKKGADPPRTWTAISSGNNNAPAALAFDSLTWTAWRAQCYMCSPGKAWIGLRFSRPVSVFCIQLYQWGKRNYKTNSIMLQRWEQGPAGTNTGWWRDVLKGSELKGEEMDLVSFTTCEQVSAPDHGRVVVTNGRFYPSDATYRCSGARLMVGGNKQSCLPDGTWSGDIPTCWPAIALVILITSVFTLELICFATYYVMVTRNKPPQLQSTTFLPDDCLGKFSSHDIYGVREVIEDEGSTNAQQNVFRHVLFCPCCRLADTWQSMGLLPYFAGVWVPQLCLPFLPCIGAYFRGQMRQRFQIQHGSSMTKDLMLWIFCCPCVATQEAKHVDHICDVAEEEAEVMRRAEERKKEKDKKIRDQIAAKHAVGGVGALAVGKGEGDEEGKPKEDLKAMGSAEAGKHQTFLEAKSVMDILQTV